MRALYEKLQAAKDVNAMNLVSEHLNNPKRAKDRYAGTPNYAATIAQVEEAMAARIVQEVTTPTVIYSGFPSNMGENGVKMTLAVFGEVADFTAEESDDGMTMGGRVSSLCSVASEVSVTLPRASGSAGPSRQRKSMGLWCSMPREEQWDWIGGG